MTNESALAGRLRVVVGRLRRRMQDASAVGDLSAPQASALARLALTEPASASELAGGERVRPQSMAATLAALQEQGLIRREADPHDGRRQLLRLTDEGRARAQGARSNREEWLVGSIRQFTAEEKRVLDAALVLLERLVDG